MKKTVQPYHATSYPLPLGFNGRLAWIYRWLSGRPLNGHRYTDATGFRYGTMSLDVSGHATTFQLLPGYRRFLYGRLPVMVSPLLAGMWILGHEFTISLLLAGVALLASPGVVATWKARKFRRDVVEPLGAGVSAVLKSKRVVGKGHTWINVPANIRENGNAKITINLPPEWVGDPGDRARLSTLVANRLNLEEVAASWTLHGAVPCVSFSVPPKPPKLITFQDALLDMSRTSEDAPMVGYGARDKVETFSLLLESPHALIAGGSGAGKSVLLAALVGQFMRNGYGVVVLDAKFTSHMWLRRIPGVSYNAESQELHEALIWLDAELLRRARLVSLGADPAAIVPLVVLMEEMNGASNRLRSYWGSIKQQGDPQMSPALTALANLSSMGRELRMHILMAGQSLTAKAVGGPENRENFGARMLGRATGAQWRMLAPQIKPAPIKRQAPGRWHLVVGDQLKEFQVPLLEIKFPDEASKLINFALSGKPIPDVVAMMADRGGVGTEIPQNIRSEATPPSGISLRQYASEINMELKTIIRWRERRSDFPMEVGEGANNTKLYDRDHLKAYVAARLREPATADE